MSRARRSFGKPLPTHERGRRILGWVAAGSLVGCLALVGPKVDGAGVVLFGVVTAALGATAALLVLRRSGAAPSAGASLAAQIAEHVDRIMIGGAETSFFLDTLKKKISSDLKLANEISSNTETIAHTTEGVAANAARASSAAASVLDESARGRAEIASGVDKIQGLKEHAVAASKSMAALQEKSAEIQVIAEVIDEIATRTNLLALNAAIEAARAGDRGRGFAVVAQEVRHLAKRTKSATVDIATMLRQIQEQAELSSGSMKALAEQVGEATAPAERAVAMLDQIRALAAESDAQVQAIASAAREHVGTTGQMSRSLKTILDGMERSGREVPVAASAVLTLAETAEKAFAVISQHRKGDGHDDRHATIRDAATRAAARVAQTFEQAVSQGRISEADLFDRSYQPIAGTNPPKFTTRFDRFTDETLPAIQEPILEEHATVAYAGAVDDRGYFPTHNRRFSRPLTGDYDFDLANNRTKRIFGDRTGSRCGSNTQPFLLQTYKRDTGEVMHDVSVPIYVFGRHWGGFRIGYRSVAETGLGVAAPVTVTAAAEPRLAAASATTSARSGALPRRSRAA